MTDEILIAKLDEVAAAIRAATLPPDLRWLDAKALGELLGFSARHVMERIACKPDFPRPARIAGGHPRWKAKEVDSWMEQQRRLGKGRARPSRAA